MKVLNLRCPSDHRFEGWFASEDDYRSQTERALIECPGSVTEPAAAGTPTAEAQPDQFMLQSAWLRAVQHVMKHTDDVGTQYAEEARRMHYGEADERPIRGQATSDEARALHDEGIEVMALPMPTAIKGTVQ